MKFFLNKYWWAGLILALVGSGVWWWFWGQDKPARLGRKPGLISPAAPNLVLERPLKKFSFPELRKRLFVGGKIELSKKLAEEPKYTAYLFFYQAEGKRVSGQANIPKGTGPFPVVIMLRGFVDQEIYETGVGTKRAAAYFARQGFVTLAPDFLGFGESDMPPENVFHERFLRPVEVLELMASVKSLPQVDEQRMVLWGHSNGGQLALSVLEISGKKIPTSLWAPVSKPFPYSILYYTDEFEDKGKALRKVLAGLEAQYEASDYSIDEYYSWIEAPLQIHQGTGDEAVPVKWSEELAKTLKKLNKEVQLYLYEGADHNLKGAWDEAVARDVRFFKSRFNQ